MEKNVVSLPVNNGGPNGDREFLAAANTTLERYLVSKAAAFTLTYGIGQDDDLGRVLTLTEAPRPAPAPVAEPVV